MWPKFLLLLGGLLTAGAGYAQFEMPMASAYCGALGGATAAVPGVRAGLHNVAGLAFERDRAVVLDVRNDFMLSQLTAEAAALAWPVAPRRRRAERAYAVSDVAGGAWTVQFLRHGSANFCQQRLSAGYALPLARHAAMGVALDYYHAGSSDAYYPAYHLLSFAAGLQWRPAEALCLGAWVRNPAAVRLAAAEGLTLRGVYSIGASYRPMPALLTTVELEQRQAAGMALRCGLEYSLRECLFLRVGCMSRPAAYTVGFGYKGGRYGADVAVQMHDALGMTSQLSVYCRF